MIHPIEVRDKVAQLPAHSLTELKNFVTEDDSLFTSMVYLYLTFEYRNGTYYGSNQNKARKLHDKIKHLEDEATKIKEATTELKSNGDDTNNIDIVMDEQDSGKEKDHISHLPNCLLEEMSSYLHVQSLSYLSRTSKRMFLLFIKSNKIKSLYSLPTPSKQNNVHKAWFHHIITNSTYMKNPLLLSQHNIFYRFKHVERIIISTGLLLRDSQCKLTAFSRLKLLEITGSIDLKESQLQRIRKYIQNAKELKTLKLSSMHVNSQHDIRNLLSLITANANIHALELFNVRFARNDEIYYDANAFQEQQMDLAATVLQAVSVWCTANSYHDWFIAAILRASSQKRLKSLHCIETAPPTECSFPAMEEICLLHRGDPSIFDISKGNMLGRKLKRISVFLKHNLAAPDVERCTKMMKNIFLNQASLEYCHLSLPDSAILSGLSCILNGKKAESLDSFHLSITIEVVYYQMLLKHILALSKAIFRVAMNAVFRVRITSRRETIGKEQMISDFSHPRYNTEVCVMRHLFLGHWIAHVVMINNAVDCCGYRQPPWIMDCRKCSALSQEYCA